MGGQQEHQPQVRPGLRAAPSRRPDLLLVISVDRETAVLRTTISVRSAVCALNCLFVRVGPGMSCTRLEAPIHAHPLQL